MGGVRNDAYIYMGISFDKAGNRTSQTTYDYTIGTPGNETATESYNLYRRPVDTGRFDGISVWCHWKPYHLQRVYAGVERSQTHGDVHERGTVPVYLRV